MSHCLILQQYNDFYIGADSAGSIKINDSFYRTSNDMQKIFKFGSDIYFCSGVSNNVDICNDWIIKNNKDYINIEQLKDFLIHKFNKSSSEDCFDVEFLICRIENGVSKIYHLAQYNNFDINIYDGRKNKINLLCGGCKTSEGFLLVKNLIKCGNVQRIYTDVFKELSDDRIGGTLYLYHNQDLIYKDNIDNYEIKTHLVLADALVGGYIEGSEISGGRLKIGGKAGTFIVNEDGSVEIRAGTGDSSYDVIDRFDDAIDRLQNSRQYHVQLSCDNSTILTTKNQSATITCKVFEWDNDITDKLPNGTKFYWKRSSNSKDDATWNENHITTKSDTNKSTCNQITITNTDVVKNSQFTCQVEFNR